MPAEKDLYFPPEDEEYAVNQGAVGGPYRPFLLSEILQVTAGQRHPPGFDKLGKSGRSLARMLFFSQRLTTMHCL